MNSQQLNIEQIIEKDRLDQLYERSIPASLTLLVISFVYILFLSKLFPRQSLLTWYLPLTIVLSGRWILARYYAKAQKQNISISLWLNLFRLGVLAAGLMIGSLNIFFFPHDPITYLLIAIIFPYGITTGAVTILVDFVSFSIYATTMLGPIIYQASFAGDRLHPGTGILTFILIIFFLKFNKEYNDNYITTMRLRYQNKNLVDDLKQEKNQLNNRLGRIFNDSSNEIFIVDAESLNCLQVNMGAVENLGYSPAEFSRTNLLDIFTDLDHYSFSTLVAPLYKKQQETVVYKGMNRRSDGSTYPVEAKIQLSTEDSPPIIVVIAQDITERNEWEEKLIYQANFDQLTGLFNRHYMQSFMDQAFTRARRHHRKIALLFIDIDDFKQINDTLGHLIGDEVLKQTADRISTLLRASDTPARTGGDEFTILLEELQETSHAEVVARKLVNLLRKPYTINEEEVHASVSIGISLYPDDGESLVELMQCADMAMYQVKKDGRNNYRAFSREMRQSSEKHMLISKHLRYALDRGEFSLAFQPKINITRHRISGAEALLRWHNPELGDISPVIFIPLAEKMGFINKIGNWVLEQACHEAKLWQQIHNDRIHVSVNISPPQFRTGELLDAVDQALTKSGLDRACLELEITENLLMQDSDIPMTLLNNLHEQGISLALDDFGTGYSSLSYLQRFPLQVLKIDRIFVNDLETNKRRRALVEAIIAMAKSLKLTIVAEGVETEAQLNFLRFRDVSIIQGFLFSQPLPAAQFRHLLQNQSMIKKILLKADGSQDVAS